MTTKLTGQDVLGLGQAHTVCGGVQHVDKFSTNPEQGCVKTTWNEP